MQSQGRTVHDFIVSLRYNYVSTSDPQEDGRENPSAFRWQLLSKSLAPYTKLAPGASCMLGPMDVQVKVRSDMGQCLYLKGRFRE